jgi:replicative DNA helicase
MNAPQNIEAEQALLGACLLDGQKAVDEASLIIEANDLYREAHREIFENVLSLSLQKTPIDIITVSEALGDRLEKVGGRAYLIELANKVPSGTNIPYYAEIIKEKSLARAKIQTNLDEVKRLYDGEGSSVIISQSMVNSMNLLNGRKKNDIVPINSILPAVYDQIEENMEGNGITGTPTGYSDFDQICGGLQVGMIIVAARPSMGKTTFALNIARNVASGNQGVLIFSLEMTKKQLARKFLSMESGVNSRLFNNPKKIPEWQWIRISHAMNKLSNMKIHIDDTSGLKASEILIRSRQFKTLNPNLGLIVIDYIGLMSPEKNTGNKNNDIGETSKLIKMISKELDVPVLTLCQLNRAVEGRSSKIPTLADLRESGNLEQDADMVLFLHRKDYYEPEGGAPDPSETDLIIAKNRLDGGVGAVKLNYFKATQRFELFEKYRQVG